MKDIAGLSKWLLEKDIRTKNATSLLVALLSVVVFFFASKHRGWFQDVESYGPVGVAVALVIVLLTSFLSTSLIWSGIVTIWQQRVARKEKEERREIAARTVEQKKRAVRASLESLTEWQRKFLLRFVVEDRTQIPEFEVGQFKATWDFEMAVLVEKGIILEHRRAGVFEIQPVYLEYLKANWNPKTGTLE